MYEITNSQVYLGQRGIIFGANLKNWRARSDGDTLEGLTEEIGALYANIAELYKIWEVTGEYSEIQLRAMQILGTNLHP